MTWNENDHPRDEIGRFTFKDGGVVETLKGGVEKTQGTSIISELLEKIDIGEAAAIAIDVLGKIATPAIKLYSNANDLINLIKINKLEDKFNIALQNTIREKEKNIKNISSVNNKNSNKEYKVNNVKYSSKIKEDSINFLGSDKRKNNNIESDFKQNKKYKDVLLDILGNKATPADILYGTQEKLEKKIKEYGLENKLKGTMTGTVSNINKQETLNKTGDYGFNHPALNIFHYRKLSKEYDREVGEFLQNNTDNPKDYSNDIRHQFVSAIFARNLGEDVAKRFGDINELMPADLLDPIDSKIDKINNEIGRNYAKQYPNMPREQLLKLMLKEYPKNKRIIIQKMNEKTEKQKKLEREYL